MFLLPNGYSLSVCFFFVQEILIVRVSLQFQELKVFFFYYINTNEIPGELSRENMTSSHVKITCYLRTKRSPLLWLHNKSRLSQRKVKWLGIS